MSSIYATVRRSEATRYNATVSNAFVAAADVDFFKHSRFHSIASLAALLSGQASGADGGASLVDQLVKSRIEPSGRGRMLRELLITIVAEAFLPKREVANAYLDTVYLGRAGNVTLIGVPSAARYYFSKTSNELSVAEAATLAGMTQNPRYYSPALYPERARERRRFVLTKMRNAHFISAAEFVDALNAPCQ
jgi:membrane peptidoglycan carboxypeptidase